MASTSASGFHGFWMKPCAGRSGQAADGVLLGEAAAQHDADVPTGAAQLAQRLARH